MNTDRQTFGPSLRHERESQGLTLKDIATSTKIQESLLAALERNDFSQWPAGIYRRGFLREYAAAIGLPPEQVVADFGRLFPEDSPLPPPEPRLPVEIRGDLRLTLAANRVRQVAAVRRQLRAAVLDLAAVALVTSLLALATHMTPWLVLGTVGLGYWTLGTAVFGRSVGMWWTNREASHPSRPRGQEAATARAERTLPRLAVSGGQEISPSDAVIANSQLDSTQGVPA